MKSSRINRRTALGGFAAAATATTVSAHAQTDSVSTAYAAPKPDIDGKLLVNRPRATEVLERFGLVGMIALNPINVYYLTNITTIGVKFRSQYPGFATYAADPQAPIYLVAGSSVAWDIANGDRETAELMPYGFGGGGDIQRDSNGVPVDPGAGRTRKYHIRDDVMLTEREKRWAAALATRNS